MKEIKNISYYIALIVLISIIIGSIWQLFSGGFTFISFASFGGKIESLIFIGLCTVVPIILCIKVIDRLDGTNKTRKYGN